MRRTILVVESDSGLRGLLQNGFRRAGYDVLIAANPQHGMRIAALHWPDAALIEVHASGTAGLDLFALLRSYSERNGGEIFPAWMMTREPASELASVVVAAGARGVITKPFSAADIVATISQHFATAVTGAPPALMPRQSTYAGGRPKLTGVTTGNRRQRPETKSPVPPLAL